MKLRRLRADLSLTALDFSFTAAQLHAFRRNSITGIEAPLEHAALHDGSVDLVIMNQVIEHLWDVRAALAKLHRALRPGGHIAVSTPNLKGYDRRLFSRYWGNYYIPRHLNLFCSTTLPRLLTECGFEVTGTQQLAAPLVWVRSFQYWCKARGWRVHAAFTDHNLPALAVFTGLDLAMSVAGFETSNLQCVARKP